MNFDGLNAEGDLPPNHPLVLEALKGIISGPISEFRTTVDNLITNPSNALSRTQIDYQNILPVANAHQPQNVDRNLEIANSILNQVSSATQPQVVPQPTVNQPIIQTFTGENPFSQNDPNQPELPLFKPTEISDIYKKLFDIEAKLDTLIRYVKSSKAKEQK
jgi:hypothetical protein